MDLTQEQKQALAGLLTRAMQRRMEASQGTAGERVKAMQRCETLEDYIHAGLTFVPAVDILITANEGGCNYWFGGTNIECYDGRGAIAGDSVVDYQWWTQMEMQIERGMTKEDYAALRFVIPVDEDDSGKTTGCRVISLSMIAEAALKCSQHDNERLKKVARDVERCDVDADAADVLLQMACFGEVVYC